MTLEDVLEQMDPPQTVADVIRTAMEAWVDEHNKSQDYDHDLFFDVQENPYSCPKTDRYERELERADYLRDEMKDRQWEAAMEASEKRGEASQP
jgi:hypothetical protein